jgi:hypothetical protein
MMPVRPLPALQCTTTTLTGSAASQAAASAQNCWIMAKGGVCTAQNTQMHTIETLLMVTAKCMHSARGAGNNFGSSLPLLATAGLD